MSFAELELSETLLRAVREAEYEVATPIQTAAIPPLLAGRDLVGCAQTGTGKTAAFALPTLQRLSAQGSAPRARPPDPLPRARADPRAGVANRRQLSHLRPLHGPAAHRHLWRRRPEPAGEGAAARRRYCRRHARPAARPDESGLRRIWITSRF